MLTSCIMLTSFKALVSAIPKTIIALVNTYLDHYRLRKCLHVEQMLVSIYHQEYFF